MNKTQNEKIKNEKIKNQIKQILLDEFYSVYCDTCVFEYLSEKESEEKYGYYGCDNCNRKCMNWSLDSSSADDVTNRITQIINVYNK